MEPEAAGAPIGQHGLTTLPEGHNSVRKKFRDIQFNTMMMSSGCSRKGSLADGAGGGEEGSDPTNDCNVGKWPPALLTHSWPPGEVM